MPATDTDINVSVVKVLIDGAELAPEEYDQLIDVTVDQVSHGPAEFSLELFCQAPDPNTFEFPAAKYKLGADIEIEFGYEGATVSLFKGIIGRVDARFSGADAPSFKISGWDRLHLMTQARYTETWESTTYADVVSALTGEFGLSADADSTPNQHDQISMLNQTPYQFCSELAHRVGYELRCSDKKVSFKKPDDSASEVATLTYGIDLENAWFKTQASQQHKKMKFLSYDPASKEQIVEEATSVDNSLGAGKTGVDTVSGSPWAKTEYWVSAWAGDASASAQEMAKALLNAVAYEFLTVEAEIEGNTVVVAGSVVKFEGVTELYSGNYYVTRAIHRYAVGPGGDKGYRTKLICQQQGWQA